MFSGVPLYVQVCVHVLSANRNISTENIEVQTLRFAAAPTSSLQWKRLHHHYITILIQSNRTVTVKGAYTIIEYIVPKADSHSTKSSTSRQCTRGIHTLMVQHHSLIAHLSNTYKAQIEGGPWERWHCLLVILTKRCVSVVNV